MFTQTKFRNGYSLKFLSTILFSVVVLVGSFFVANTVFAVVGEGTANINGGANVTVTKSTSNVFTVVLTVGASGITANAENPTFTIPTGFTAPNATPVANAGLVVADGNWSVIGGATCLVDSPSVGLTAAVGQVITVDVTAACTVGTGGTITLTYKGTSSTAMGVTPLNIGVNDVISYSPVTPISTLPTITVTDIQATPILATPTLNVYQTTIGSPSGNPQGNVYVSGSAAPFLVARDAAIAGTLTNRTTYTPVESSIWGAGGTFGSELYMFSVVKDIPVGSLLKITKSGDYKDISTPNWTPGFTSYTTYYPMIAYTHTISTTAYGYLTKFDCSATVCTFVTGAALGEDYSASTPNGSANTPPTDISMTIGFQFRHTVHAEVITGSYTLTGASANRGYQQGTGYTGGDTPVNIGTLENTSTVPTPTTVYVDPSYTTTSCGSHVCYYDAFAKIQDGVNAVVVGGTVNVAAGTYNESLNITKPVTLQSIEGRDVTTIKSLTIATSSVTINGFTIDGVNASRVASANILLNSGVSNIMVSNNKIINVGVGSGNGDNGIGLLTTSNLVLIGDNLNVTGNIFQATTTGSNRAFFINPGINHFTFSGNTITGNFTHAATTQAKNGLVENNTITGAGAVGSRSAGFRAWGFPDPTVWGHTTFSGNTVSGAKRGITADEANNVTITGNTLSGNEMGVWVTANDDLPFDITTISVHNNNLSGEDALGFGVINDTATATKVDASLNWWGTAVLADISAKISGPVTYDPYYINFGMTTTNVGLANTKTTPDVTTGEATSNPTTPEVVITNPTQAVTITVVTGTDATVNVSSFITNGAGTLPQIIINSIYANVAIASSTKVTSASTTWNGVIAAPTVTTVTLPVTSGQTKTLSTAIEVGSGAKLSFDNAVRIFLPGQAGKRAGYSRPGKAFTEITNICTADDQATGNALGADSECKKNVGNDLVIWTKHFTTFATYTQTTKIFTYGITPSVVSDSGSILNIDCGTEPDIILFFSSTNPSSHWIANAGIPFWTNGICSDLTSNMPFNSLDSYLGTKNNAINNGGTLDYFIATDGVALNAYFNSTMPTYANALAYASSSVLAQGTITVTAATTPVRSGIKAIMSTTTVSTSTKVASSITSTTTESIASSTNNATSTEASSTPLIVTIVKNIVPIVVNILTAKPPLSGIVSAPVIVPGIAENPPLFDVTSQPVSSTPQNRTPFIIIAIGAWILIASLVLFIVRRITSYLLMMKAKKDMRNAKIKKNENIH